MGGGLKSVGVRGARSSQVKSVVVAEGLGGMGRHAGG